MTPESNAIAKIQDWSEVYRLAQVYRQQQQWEAAAIALQRAVELKSDFWSWHNLGDALSQLQQWQKATTAYLQGISLQPDHQLSYQKLGRSFKQQGELAETVKQYRHIIKTPPENSIFELLQSQPQQLIPLIHNLIHQHQIYGAIVVCYLLLEIQPTQVNISATLTQLLRQYQELEQAISQNQQKLEKHTASPLLTQLATNPVIKTQPKPISGQIVIQRHSSLTANQLNDLLVAVGWSSRPLAKLELTLKHSFVYITAWHIDREQKQLVGFVRAVSDSVYQATLLDVAVHPDFQGRGIGKAIVKAIVKQLQAAQIADITLFASPQLTDFYHKLGFVAQPKNLQWMLLTD